MPKENQSGFSTASPLAIPPTREWVKDITTPLAPAFQTTSTVTHTVRTFLSPVIWSRLMRRLAPTPQPSYRKSLSGRELLGMRPINFILISQKPFRPTGFSRAATLSILPASRLPR